MRVIVQEGGKLSENKPPILERLNNNVIEIIFDNAAEFNAYDWGKCPYQSVETIRIQSFQGRLNPREHTTVNDEDDALTSDEDFDSDQPVTVTATNSKKPKFNPSSTFALTSNILSIGNIDSRAERSGEPKKVTALINTLKVQNNASLTCLMILNANLLNTNVEGIRLPALTTLDLSGCKISFSNLKQLISATDLSALKFKAEQLEIVCNSEDELDEVVKFGQSLPLDSTVIKGPSGVVVDYDVMPRPPQAVPTPYPQPSHPSHVGRSEPSRHNYDLSVSSKLVSRASRAVSKSKLRVDTSKRMLAAAELYTDSLKSIKPFTDRVEVVIQVDSQTLVLLHNKDKLLQSSGNEVQVFSKLTNPKSGIDSRVQAQMILQGLGVTAVEPEDVEAATELPTIDELEFDKKNNNPALNQAIIELLNELLEAREHARPSKRF